MTEEKEEITSKEAAELLSEKYGRPITDANIRFYASEAGKKRLTQTKIDGRTRTYKRKEVMDLRLRGGPGRPRKKDPSD